jgi:glycosyltransferase involved in cell wall biosynthesis
MGESLDAVVPVHDLTFLENPEWYRRERAMYNRWGVARSVHRAKRIIAVSRATADALIKRLDVRHDRIDVVHNGVDERFVPVDDAVKAAVRERYGLQTPFFLFVGTLEPRKNVARLIQAWDRIADAFPHALVLAGRRGWKAEPIFAAAESSLFRDRIKMIGFVPHNDLAGLMGSAEAVVYPSLGEGFGIPVAEAMACGVPVLTSNVSSLPEVAGDSALLVDPTDEAAIADGLRKLADDGSLRQNLREKGLERAKQFTWRRSAEMTIGTYRTALG